MSWDISSTIEKNCVRCTAVGTFKNVGPDDLWRLLTLTEGATIFRVEQRRLLSSDGLGIVEEEVVFTAPLRVLFWKTWARTRVHQRIDTRDPQLTKVYFRLIASDLMSHLTGSWQLHAEQTENTVQTRAIYNFEMWPKGVPSGLRYMPGLLDAVKGAVQREAAQLFDKMQYVASKVGPGIPMVRALSITAAEVARSGGSFKLLRQSVSQRLPSGTNLGCAAPASAVTSPSCSASCHAPDDADLFSKRKGEPQEKFPDGRYRADQGDQDVMLIMKARSSSSSTVCSSVSSVSIDGGMVIGESCSDRSCVRCIG